MHSLSRHGTERTCLFDSPNSQVYSSRTSTIRILANAGCLGLFIIVHWRENFRNTVGTGQIETAAKSVFFLSGDILCSLKTRTVSASYIGG